jgi:hypothetical protein
MSHAWITTRTNHAFDFLECLAGQMQHYDLDEIAWCLAGEQRFAGHTIPRICVAEHSTRVGRRARQLAHGLGWAPDDVDNAHRCGHMHDAGEAYTKDISRPMKQFLRANGCDALDMLEAEIERQIAARFGLVWTADVHAIVKQADNEACAWERAHLMRHPGPRDHDWAWLPPLPPAPDVDVLRVWGQKPPEAYEIFLAECSRLGIR